MNHSPYLVSDVMTRTVVAVGPEASFKEIVATLRKWEVSALPVLEGDGRVIGVVSEADLLPKEEYHDSALSAADRIRRPEHIVKAGAVVARDLMTAPAVSVRADVTLAEAARAMALRRLKRLPVVDGEGHLTGIVSRGDLLKVFLRSDQDIAEDVRQQAIEPLFPLGGATVHVEVNKGVVTLTGWFRNTSLVPLAARMARAVEGVVDVGFRLERPDGAPGEGRRGAAAPGHEGEPEGATAPPPEEPT